MADEDTSKHLGKSHTADETLARVINADALPHSHSDLTQRGLEKARKRQLVKIDASLLSSQTSLAWAGSQAHIFSSHMSGLEKVDTEAPDDDSDRIILAPKGRLTTTLAITAAIAAFGSSFPHGWNTGVLNTPAELIKGFLNETVAERTGYIPGDQLLNLLWSLSVSIYLVGGCGGAFSAGWMANTIGRKRALLICHVFGFVASLLFAFCDMASSFEMFIIARLIVGFGCGAGSGLVPMYLTEIAPVNIRGSMGVLHQFALTVGILVSQIIGMRQILGHEDRWPYLLALTGFPCLVSACALPFLPESPRYLLVNKQDSEGAKKALQRFRCEDDVSDDLREMEAEQKQQEKEPAWTFMQLFKSKNLQMQLALVCVLAVVQQLSGINVVFYYSTDVFISSGIPQEYTQYATLATGVINVLMTAVSVPLMEKAGRRKLLLGGMIVMVVSATVMTIALNLKDLVPWISYFSIVAVVGFVIGFAIGLGSIPQFIGAELFKQGPRPPAMSFAGLLNWLANTLVGVSFPPMAPYTKGYSFIPFIVIVLGFGAFLWWKLPETKGKSFDEITRHFVKGTEEDEDSPESRGLLDSEFPKAKPKDFLSKFKRESGHADNGTVTLNKLEGRLYNSTGVL